jgi:hypothetical protein
MGSYVIAMLVVAALAQDEEIEQPAQKMAVMTVRVGVNDVNIGKPRQSRELILEFPAPPAPVRGAGDLPPRPVLPMATATLAKSNFDRWVFAEGGYNETARQRILEDLLRRHVENSVRAYKLDRSHQAKLLLAGRGDIKRFFDQVEERRPEFEKKRKNFQEGFAYLRRLEPLSKVYQEGPFGDGSLYAKTLQKIRDDQDAEAAASLE